MAPPGPFARAGRNREVIPLGTRFQLGGCDAGADDAAKAPPPYVPMTTVPLPSTASETEVERPSGPYPDQSPPAAPRDEPNTSPTVRAIARARVGHRSGFWRGRM